LLTKDLPPVDLLIRTGNEKRISNFMLWQSSYAEIIFEPTLWPAYNSQIFTKNLLEFSKRQRRFGRI
jgi:undecaprenyl diphosphate synthase